MSPYRGPSGREQVAVTPARPSAATRARTPPAAASGATTSATPMAWAWPPTVTLAVDPTPNHSLAGLSSVNSCSATSVSAGPGGRPITDTAVW